MANTADTATQLRQATFELTRLKTDFATRLELLETIRPTLHYICARLDRTAVGTSAQGDAIARLAQRLTTNLCSGYKVVIAEVLGQTRSRRTSIAKEVVPLATHRALSIFRVRCCARCSSTWRRRTGCGSSSISSTCWPSVSRSPTAATRTPRIHGEPITTIADAYLRPALLACCKPNQLRHRHLAQVFNALELWTPEVTLAKDRDDAMFVVDLESDQGPTYSRLISDPAEARSIKTDVLVYELEAYLKEIDGGIPVPDYLDDDILQHLVDAWGLMRPRAHRRAPASGSVKVCVGLRPAHYFLSGGVEFADQLSSTDALLRREINPFLDGDLGAPVTGRAKPEGRLGRRLRPAGAHPDQSQDRGPRSHPSAGPREEPSKRTHRQKATFTTTTPPPSTRAPAATGSAGTSRCRPTSRPASWWRCATSPIRAGASPSSAGSARTRPARPWASSCSARGRYRWPCASSTSAAGQPTSPVRCCCPSSGPSTSRPR